MISRLLLMLLLSLPCAAQESSWLARDKALHTAGGYVLADVVLHAVKRWAPGLRAWHARLIAAAVTAGAGIGYEVWTDHRETSPFDWRDAAATTAGGVGVLLIDWRF